MPPSDPFDHALLQKAQQLDLQSERQIADFVEEERPAVGRLDLADGLFRRARERALFVPEELAFEQRFGNRRAVDRDEPVALPRREIVQRAREQLLAGAGLAKNQKSGRCRRDLLDGATNLLHSGIARDDSRHHGRLLHRLEAPVLLLQVVNTECPLEHQRQDHGFERLLAVKRILPNIAEDGRSAR